MFSEGHGCPQALLPPMNLSLTYLSSKIFSESSNLGSLLARSWDDIKLVISLQCGHLPNVILTMVTLSAILPLTSHSDILFLQCKDLIQIVLKDGRMNTCIRFHSFVNYSLTKIIIYLSLEDGRMENLGFYNKCAYVCVYV